MVSIIFIITNLYSHKLYDAIHNLTRILTSDQTQDQFTQPLFPSNLLLTIKQLLYPFFTLSFFINQHHQEIDIIKRMELKKNLKTLRFIVRFPTFE